MTSVVVRPTPLGGFRSDDEDFSLLLEFLQSGHTFIVALRPGIHALHNLRIFFVQLGP